MRESDTRWLLWARLSNGQYRFHVVSNRGFPKQEVSDRRLYLLPFSRLEKKKLCVWLPVAQKRRPVRCEEKSSHYVSDG